MHAIVGWLVLGVGLVLYPQAKAQGQTVEMTLEQRDGKEWLIRYETSEPVKQLALVRRPNDTRSSRANGWRALDPEIDVVLEDGEDIIRRKDGDRFDKAEFSLAARYTSITFDYPTFVPFSDGGLLIYTGRFVACPETCDDPFASRLKLEPKSRQVLMSETGWHYAYVGDNPVQQGADFSAVIDAGLPDHLRTSLSDLIPKLMRYFEKPLGRLPIKPMLFASLDVSMGDEREGYDGGTLSGEQIYLFFVGTSWQDADAGDLERVAWFVAHETFHLFQDSPVLPRSQAWVKEGLAEAMAAMAVRDLGLLGEREIAERVEKQLKGCADALRQAPLSEQAALEQFRPYYDCGLIMYLAADAALDRASAGDATLFSIWKDFKQQVEAGADADQRLMVELIAQQGDRATADFLNRLITEPLDDPEAVLRLGLERSGYR